jgi:hypothetical protein
MKSDIQNIQSILLATAVTIGDELAFVFPEVLEVIKLCTINEIAVLGVENFEDCSGQYSTKNLSIYDQQIGRGPEERNDWLDYVNTNNALAEEFIRLNPAADKSVYMLTTSSWREFCNIHELRNWK